MIGCRAPSISIASRISDDGIAKFWRRVLCVGKDSCWLYVVGSEPLTYPSHQGIAAHRLAWFLANGAEPGELRVCHSCDTRHCVNPGHLWLGTDGDNWQDSRLKGRWSPSKGARRQLGCGDWIRDLPIYRQMLDEIRAEIAEAGRAQLRSLRSDLPPKDWPERWNIVEKGRKRK